eukprot:RCo023551
MWSSLMAFMRITTSAFPKPKLKKSVSIRAEPARGCGAVHAAPAQGVRAGPRMRGGAAPALERVAVQLDGRPCAELRVLPSGASTPCSGGSCPASGSRARECSLSEPGRLAHRAQRRIADVLLWQEETLSGMLSVSRVTCTVARHFASLLSTSTFRWPCRQCDDNV